MEDRTKLLDIIRCKLCHEDLEGNIKGNCPMLLMCCG